MAHFNSTEIEPADQYRVVSGIPHVDEPEFKEYEVDSEDIVELLQAINNPAVAELVITVDPVEK